MGAFAHGVLGSTRSGTGIGDNRSSWERWAMIHFVGAGPGAPDLITVRGATLLARADVILYAGSLVNPELLDLAPATVEIHDSARLTLEQVLDVMVEADAAGRELVRLHTGDPSLYGAIREQMEALEGLGITELVYYPALKRILDEYSDREQILDEFAIVRKRYPTLYEPVGAFHNNLLINMDYGRLESECATRIANYAKDTTEKEVLSHVETFARSSENLSEGLDKFYSWLHTRSR